MVNAAIDRRGISYGGFRFGIDFGFIGQGPGVSNLHAHSRLPKTLRVTYCNSR